MQKVPISFDVVCNSPTSDQVIISGKTRLSNIVIPEIIDIVLTCDQHSYPLWKGDHVFNSLEEALDYEFSLKICHQGGTIRIEEKSSKLTLDNIRSQNCKLSFKGSTVIYLPS